MKPSCYLQAQAPLKLFEPPLQPPGVQQPPLEKKMKPFRLEPYNHSPSEAKGPDFYWDSACSLAQPTGLDRRGKRPPGVFRPEPDPAPRMPFEVRILTQHCLSSSVFGVWGEREEKVCICQGCLCSCVTC